MNMNAPPNPFATLWAMGYGPRLVPIAPPGCEVTPDSSFARRLAAGRDDRGKAPAERLPGGAWRGDRSWLQRQPTLADVETWFGWGASVGLKTGNGLVAIDADCLTDSSAEIAREEIERGCGLLPLRVGRPPKLIYVCRTDEDFSKIYFKFGDLGERIEILGSGFQFVAHGVHPGTLKPYKWLRRLPPYDELPMVGARHLRELIKALRSRLPKPSEIKDPKIGLEIDQNSLAGDINTVREAVAAMANTDELFPTREDYLDVGYSIKAALGAQFDSEAFEIWWSWCERWRDGVNEREIAEADWARMKPPFRIGADWLWNAAERASGGAWSRAALWFEPIADEGVGLFGPEPAEAAPAAGALLGTPFAFPEPSAIPPREFLYGYHYLRQYVSATIAPTKVGKSSLVVVEALAMASGKPLLGVKPTGIYRVRIWNGEDPVEEMSRRVAAAMMAHGLTREDIGDRLLLDSGRDMPICVAVQTREGARIVRPIADAVLKSLEIQKVDALIVDPFIKSHGVSENDNNAIDAVAREWNAIAGVARVAIDLVHHSRKLNGAEVTIDDSRGASALVSAARSARVLARMTRTEGDKWGKGEDYRRFFRFADASSNMALPAFSEEAWMELRSIDLGNARRDTQGRIVTPSDSVGVVMAAPTQATAHAVDDEAEARILAEFASGDWRSDPQARDAWAGVAVARVHGIDLDAPEGRAHAKAILKNMAASGKIIYETRRGKDRHMRGFVTVAALDLFS